MVAQSTKAVSQRRRIAALSETGSRQGPAESLKEYWHFINEEGDIHSCLGQASLQAT
jgi:hypothetical protein